MEKIEKTDKISKPKSSKQKEATYYIEGMWYSGNGWIEKWIRLSTDNVVIQSEQPIDNTFSQEGVSSNDFKVLVLRNPLNMFAERLLLHKRAGYNVKKQKKSLRAFTTVINMWKDYAKKCLSSRVDKMVVVNYDKWLDDASYRKELAELLDIKDKLPKDFKEDDLVFYQKISCDHPFYAEVFDDKELMDLIHEIFGKDTTLKEASKLFNFYKNKEKKEEKVVLVDNASYNKEEESIVENIDIVVEEIKTPKKDCGCKH